MGPGAPRQAEIEARRDLIIADLPFGAAAQLDAAAGAAVDLHVPPACVRVFPDEIFLNIHEVALTEEERDAAQTYYGKLNDDETINERELWRDMVARFGAERSAYILPNGAARSGT